MNVENIVLLITIISFLFILMPNDKKVNIKEWRYDSNSHIMCLILKDKTLKDIYFININGIWYSYPNGAIANQYWSKICNDLIHSRKPM